LFQSLIGIYGFSRYIVRGESLPIQGFKPYIGIYGFSGLKSFFIIIWENGFNP